VLPASTKVRTALAALAGILLASTSALAADHEVAPPKPALRSRWYGWQNLAADGTSLTLMASGLAVGDTPGNYLMGAGAAGWVLGGPLIHFGHKNPGRAVASFALHVPLPVALGLGTVALVCHGHGDFCGLVAIPGALVGVVIAVVVDGAVLGRDRVLVVPAARVGRVRITPTFAPVQRGAVVGLALTM
jgi:hypothetical protein